MSLLRKIVSTLSYLNAALSGPPTKGRSGKWPKKEREAFVRDHFECQWCGKGIEQVKIVGHHIQGFKEHPELELALSNVVTLCQPLGGGCHLHQGHINRETGECNWHTYNPNIAEECAKERRKR